MTVGGGEAADQLVRMMLSGSEVVIRLGGSAAKNLLALSLALAKDHKKLSGKVSMGKMLRQTRDLRTFPMTPEQFQQFKKQARKQGLLYASIHDQDDKGKLVDVVLPVTEIDRANIIFERILKPGEQPGQPAPEPEEQRQEQSVDTPEGRESQELNHSRIDQQRTKEPAAKKREADIQKVTLSKKGSRSERGSPDTKVNSDSPSKDKATSTTSDRPSVEARLKGYQEQIKQGTDMPIRHKAKAEQVK